MRLPQTTSLLSGINMSARSGRERFTPPETYFEQVTDTYAEVWFPTGGCIWDAIGHCTTCNYGAPAPVAPDSMVHAVEVAVAALAPTTETLWVSAFDTLQNREVPADARRRIFEVLARSPARTVITETHPASVRSERVAECVELLDGRQFAVQLGVETMAEFVRYTCVNKPFSQSQLARAVRTLHDHGAEAWANLIVGIPFLTHDEVVEGTARSVRDAVRFGFDNVVLFPNHVKEYTIAYLLADAGRYHPPNLWDMRDVLARVPDDMVGKVHMAWVELKPHPGAAAVFHEPTRQATERLRAHLEAFNLHRDRDALTAALALDRPDPVADDSAEPDLVPRLLGHYRWLADHHGTAGWWTDHGAEIEAELTAANRESGAVLAA
jgi:radical SAM enzyme (TIGR01210 family)